MPTEILIIFLTSWLGYRFLNPRPLSDFEEENEGDKMWVYVKQS